jgi:hypothetical protein
MRHYRSLFDDLVGPDDSWNETDREQATAGRTAQ